MFARTSKKLEDLILQPKVMDTAIPEEPTSQNIVIRLFGLMACQHLMVI